MNMNDFNKDLRGLKVHNDRFDKFQSTVKGSMLVLLGGWFVFVVALVCVVVHFIHKFW